MYAETRSLTAQMDELRARYHQYLQEQKIKKKIFVPNRLMNIII